MLSHSSGLPHGERREPYPLFFAPGSSYKYSAGGYRYLQGVVEHLTGRRLDELADEYVLDPLGMEHSSLVWLDAYETTSANGHDPAGRPQPFRKYTDANAAASMYTTAADYARFVVAVLDGEGLGEAIRQEMLSPQIEIDEHDLWSLGFGLQRDANGDAFWQWGDYGIFRNFVIAYPEQRSGVVYLTNSFYGLSICDELVNRSVGGTVHALPRLGYDSYRSPALRLTWTAFDEGVDAAIARLPEWRAEDPEALGEDAIDSLGYAMISVGRFDDAIALFQLNVKEHPASANTYDSLAEAYMRRNGAGDVERAIEYYRKSLQAIPYDSGADKAFLESLRRNAEQQLAELEKLRASQV